MKLIKVITFDAGGTLLHPFPSVGEIYGEVLMKHGVVLKPSDLEDGFRKAWQASHQTTRVGISENSEKDWWRNMVLQTLRGYDTPQNFDEFFDELWQTFADPHRWKLYDRAQETLTELKGRGYRLAILSNWDHRLRTLLVGMGLSPLFEDLFISSEVGFEKPDERIFKVVEERMGVSAANLLHVGDSGFHDVQGAKKVGWQSVQIVHRGSDPSTREKIRCLSELPGLVVL